MDKQLENFESIQDALVKIKSNFQPVTLSKEDSKILENVDEVRVTYKFNEENGELVAQKLSITYNDQNEIENWSDMSSNNVTYMRQLNHRNLMPSSSSTPKLSSSISDDSGNNSRSNSENNVDALRIELFVETSNNDEAIDEINLASDDDNDNNEDEDEENREVISVENNSNNDGGENEDENLNEWIENEPLPENLLCRVKNCTLSKNPHKIHERFRVPFSRFEQIFMIKYLIKNKCIDDAKGNVVWKNMIKEGCMTHRSYQSLNNHFRRTILRDIETFKLPKIYKNRFLILRTRVNNKNKKTS